MAVILSANMNLPVPVVGTEPGPDWAIDLNSCLALLDSHDHSAGSGVKVTPAGMDISSDLYMGNNNLTAARSVRFQPQGAVLSLPTDLGCLYEVGDDLYYNDGAGNNVRITQSGAVAGTPGSIANLVAPASASYVSANSTFVWESDANKPAHMDAGDLILRNFVVGGFGLTLSAPTLTANYGIQLPLLPVSTQPVSVDPSGVMTAGPLTFAQLVAAVQQALNPAGTIIAFAGAAVPTGYLLCDGAAVSRSTYSTLFAAIGEEWGEGDGATTFNVPDLRGRFIRGVDDGAGNDPDAASRTAINVGGATGDNVGSLQDHALQSHTHIATWNLGVGGTAAGTAAQGSLNGVDQLGRANIDDAGNWSTETRPVNAYVTFCIKV